ncbi:hypothetical protein IJG20_00215 [Candidatus Saccharibacteria bacterium]|nr:hypothetical protein [Candidatus Saccharibacteria bacterium]
MEKSEPIITAQDTSPIPPVPVSTPEKPQKQPRRTDEKQNKRLIIIICAVVAVIALGVGIFFLVKNWDNIFKSSGGIPEEETPSEILIPGGTPEETGEGQSVEEYVAEKQAAIDSATNSEDSFDAKINLASFYVAIEDFDQAQGILDSFDVATLTNDEAYRYYNIMARLAEGRGDTEKLEEYSARAMELRNAM